ncbi:MAG: hypothetical protein A2857_01180 [Candidatus Levybacteria bacterium RIFCSPHIGHO2_01_FULL_36_15]|nr:MAG: hypothetical protein A2857_01180 [Candidatus Levybacteria bacterium RIFCSPHIGHO2_01_FULL_36_15]
MSRKNEMTASLIITVLNEGKTIIQFLNSVAYQSKQVKEMIIVDGGSTDDTLSAISNFSGQKSQLSSKKTANLITNIKLIIKKGNRSVGRNEAIKNAAGDIIVCSDAGCILDNDWFKNIIKPFRDKKVDVVAGYYKGEAETVFQKCLIPYVLVMPDRVNSDTFLPATRSMAFKKSIWKKIGGFDERLSHNEDYAFAKRLKIINVKIVFTKDAIVNWIPRRTLKKAFNMFFRFAYGDAEARIFRFKVILIFLRYLTGLVLLASVLFFKSLFLFAAVFFLILMYFIWAIIKNYIYVKNLRAFFYLPLIQITSDIAVLLGTLAGLIKRFNI